MSPNGAPILVDGYPARLPPLAIGNLSLANWSEEFVSSFVNIVS